jgi:uncharacterized iron-regulated protein
MMKVLFSMLFCLWFAGCATYKFAWQSPYADLTSLQEGEIVHIPTGVAVTPEQMIDILARQTIVYVGETHDNMNAHRIQLEILKALWDRHPGKVAVGMEMLKRPSQKTADQWVSGQLDEKELVRAWVDDWTNDFLYYRDILLYIRERGIPLIALRASDAWMAAVKDDSGKDRTSAAAAGEEAVLPEMDLEDAYHRSHIKAVFEKHPARDQDFEAFYKVQVLWDESMAQSIRDYLVKEEGKDKHMVVFAGVQHVEHGFGIPRRVFRRLAVPYAIVIPVSLSVSKEPRHEAMDLALPDVPLFPADFAWAITYENLEDERVYLGVIIDSAEKGVKVMHVAKGSAAEKAGLQKEDIITAVDGEPVKTPFDLTYAIGKKKKGDKGIVEVLRGDAALHLEVTFEAGRFHM